MYVLNQIDLEDINDSLPIFEKHFKIKLGDDEIKHLKNFDEFCNVIISKFELDEKKLCTSQRAFYQFKRALEAEKINNGANISPDTNLKDLFPKKNRIKTILRIEKQLGYQLELLQPSQSLVNSLFYLFVLSLIGLFFNWEIAIYGILSSIFLGFYFTKFSKRLDKKCVRELIEKTTAMHYFQIRNTAGLINQNEFKLIIINWFAEHTGIEKKKLELGTIL